MKTETSKRERDFWTSGFSFGALFGISFIVSIIGYDKFFKGEFNFETTLIKILTLLLITVFAFLALIILIKFFRIAYKK